MLTNLIYYLYNIKVDYIRKNKDNYNFVYENDFYILKPTTLSDEYIFYINKYFIYNNLFHILIKSRYDKYIIKYNDKEYVLMKVRFGTNRLLMVDDIINNNLILNINKINWIDLWKRKIDQVELYIYNNEMSIYNLAIINYYLELGECAISYYLNNIKDDILPITFCHKRINKDFDLYDYYSITDIVFDHKVRDISEYIKCDIYNDKEISLDKYKGLINYKDKELLISRLMFPCYFFDIIDDFIINNKDFKDFSSFFTNMEIYEKNLLKIIDFIAK
jgi:hypothetical protein